MGILRDAGWPDREWDGKVVWEEEEGDFHALPATVKHETSWGELYRVAYRLFAEHKAACAAEAPRGVPFGPETWSRVNVSGEFKHCLLSLSRWYDDFVAGPHDSHGELYLRDIAVYRRDERFFNLYPHAPTTRHARDSGGGGSSGSSGEPASRDAIPAELVSRLASFVNEPSAEAMHSSIGAWPSSISDLFITIPLRRLLILDENNCLSHWISCGELCEDSDDDEDAASQMAIDRFRGAEALRAHVRLRALPAGAALALLRGAAAEASLGGSEAAAVAGAAERLGLGGAGLPPGETGDRQTTPGTQLSATDCKRALLQRLLHSIRRFVFPDISDADIASGAAKVVLLYLSDSDVWSDGPGANEHQPAANFVFFHHNLAVLFTSHVPHC
eukprot:jgi/Tetstr1/446748/TSEL_034235.t1